ncbi:hypothetical protein LshimejAT787_0500030 [Lyophyllum shimeji]|uniref:Uncharacterized protein n=1 Tax=Lyophyllum shimeji TaxID=47721 RepID=A0A9P3ULZ0_LYOSH|nr:hypothetical protein LshimejAT787_0500030 [Lyophyllum shimeji]
MHRDVSPPPNDTEEPEETFTYIRHPFLTGDPCDANGEYLPPHAPPPPKPEPTNDWHPFESRTAFDFACFHFSEVQSSEKEINRALDIWLASIIPFGGRAQWEKAEEVYETIDSIEEGECPWSTYKIRYQGPLPDNPPKWMTETYELCTRDSRQVVHHQVAMSGFKHSIHYGPYRQFNSKGDRVWSNLMSGDWCWKQADEISKLPDTRGAIFVPIVAGSDKTTVSVATGHQQYHPVYISPGGLMNIARRARGNAVLPVAFLPIPKVSQKEQKSPLYQRFARQLYHACLARVFAPLKAGMTTPEVIRCPDGHFRRAIYSLGPYIADYPEQVVLAAIVQNWCPKCDARPDCLDDPALRRSHAKTEFIISCFDPGILWTDYGIRTDVSPFTRDFPRADIHELLSPDLLHQLIKGTFKDHLVMWVGDYLILTHGETRAKEIIQDIDRRISAVPSFPGLRRFYDGRNFTQWTGDDSKALMKVYLAAITGHVPLVMVQCMSAFLDFCYIARRNSLSNYDIKELKSALTRFHHLRAIFIETGVRVDISLPRQHSMVHYPHSIRLFGSPNGLCSSITESKHIQAVKEPWRRSNRYNALIQMLRTLVRLDKLSAAERRFAAQGMMAGSTSSYAAFIHDGGVPEAPGSDDEDDGDSDDDLGPATGPKVMSSVKLAVTPERNYPKDLEGLARHIQQPRFPEALRRFLYQQIYPDIPADDIVLDDCPRFHGRISVYHSAVARYFSPSDICGVGGMHRERIRSHPNWRGLYPRYDTVFVETDSDTLGMLGMTIGRVLLFFSFSFCGEDYPCALVNWFIPVGGSPDEETGFWMVKPEYMAGGHRSLAVVHLDCVARGAHLLPVYGTGYLPEDFHFSQALNAFRAYFVNRHVDHHTHEFLK